MVVLFSLSDRALFFVVVVLHVMKCALHVVALARKVLGSRPDELRKGVVQVARLFRIRAFSIYLAVCAPNDFLDFLPVAIRCGRRPPSFPKS